MAVQSGIVRNPGRVLKRADILWALFEAADLAFLSWYAFSVFPRRKSGYYVNISNLDNAQLIQVYDWHLRQERILRAAAGDEDEIQPSLNEDGDDSSGIVIAGESDEIQADRNNINATENSGNGAGQLTGTAETEPEEDLEPVMITCISGDPLPSSLSEIWNMQEAMRRVLGSPRGGLEETLALVIARIGAGYGEESACERSSHRQLLRGQREETEQPDTVPPQPKSQQHEK